MNNREYDVAYVASFLMEHGHIPIDEELLQKRYDVCNACDYLHTMEVKTAKELDVDADSETVDVEWGYHEYDICGHCGCNLEGRLTEWMASCPINKWRFSYDDWEKYYLPLVKEEIQKNGGSDYYLWEGVLESENTEENTDGE
jgi:nitrite reductase/ring-hydroxylating ferredoxin subunit